MLSFECGLCTVNILSFWSEPATRDCPGDSEIVIEVLDEDGEPVDLNYEQARYYEERAWEVASNAAYLKKMGCGGD